MFLHTPWLRLFIFRQHIPDIVMRFWSNLPVCIDVFSFSYMVYLVKVENSVYWWLTFNPLCIYIHLYLLTWAKLLVSIGVISISEEFIDDCRLILWPYIDFYLLDINVFFSSSIFSRNSEANASKFLENLEETYRSDQIFNNTFLCCPSQEIWSDTNNQYAFIVN